MRPKTRLAHDIRPSYSLPANDSNCFEGFKMASSLIQNNMSSTSSEATVNIQLGVDRDDLIDDSNKLKKVTFSATNETNYFNSNSPSDEYSNSPSEECDSITAPLINNVSTIVTTPTIVSTSSSSSSIATPTDSCIDSSLSRKRQNLIILADDEDTPPSKRVTIRYDQNNTMLLF